MADWVTMISVRRRDAVGDHPAVEHEHPGGNAGRKADVAQEGRRLGQLEDQKALGRGLHPGAGQRDELADEPEAVVGVAQSRKGLLCVAAA